MLGKTVVSCVLASIGIIGGVSSHAALVHVTGGFTSFTGQSAGAIGFPSTSTAPNCDPTFQGIVAGTTVQAVNCPNGVSGPVGTLAFSSTLKSVEFYGIQLGSELRHNEVSFKPATDQTVTNVGDLFYMGDLTFTNGTWFGSGKVNAFHIELETVSATSQFDNHKLLDDIVMDIRIGSTPEDNGDCVSFNKFFAVGQLCAYEAGVPGKTNTTTAQLWGKIGSLIPTEFREVTGGFVVGAEAAAVPEPASLALIGLGLAGLGWSRRRK